MELSEYISLTLAEITEGVKKANKPYVKKDKELVPSDIPFRIEGIPYIYWEDNESISYRPIIKVAFRVGVEIEETEESNNKLGGSLKVISGVPESVTKDERRNIHEVSFDIPLVLP